MHRQDPPGHPSHPQLPQGQLTTLPRLGQSQPLPIHPQLRHSSPNSGVRPLPPYHEAPPTLHVSIHTFRRWKFHTRHSLGHTCHQVGLGLNQAASLRQQLAIPSMRSAPTDDVVQAHTGCMTIAACPACMLWKHGKELGGTCRKTLCYREVVQDLGMMHRHMQRKHL